MKEKLLNLQTRIMTTADLLDIPGKKEEMIKLEKIMQEPDFWSDQDNATAVSRTFEALKDDVNAWETLTRNVQELLALDDEVSKNPDEEIAHEIEQQALELETEFSRREFYILFSGLHDMGNAIVSFHAGSGGTEAQDWAEMLVRMITRYAEKKGWHVMLLDESKGNEAGIKSATFRIVGPYAYGHLRSEHGTHRLVRISPFDAEKMRHTSFALIEVIPELDTQEIKIDDKDLRIDTFMSGGKGGQSVNTTYSAVRIVHIPTGISVQCQNERSQLQNKETALKILAGKLQKVQEEKEAAERLQLRGEFKSPEWGSQIRSYVLHPYHMVKDLRTKFESTDTEGILNGNIDSFVEAYLRWSIE